jgi:putative Ca2+/H+ antiporter (TMEM165/GDT1 family)
VERTAVDWRLFSSTFGVLFLAELGDKTQLAVITLTCNEHKPLPIFLGASLGLVVVTLLGVVGGEALARAIPSHVMRKVAAGAFLVMGALMWFEVL